MPLPTHVQTFKKKKMSLLLSLMISKKVVHTEKVFTERLNLHEENQQEKIVFFFFGVKVDSISDV